MGFASSPLCSAENPVAVHESRVATASLTKRREIGRRHDLFLSTRRRRSHLRNTSESNGRWLRVMSLTRTTGTSDRRVSGFAATIIVHKHAGGLALGGPCCVSLRAEPRTDNQSRGIEFFAELLSDAMAAIEIAAALSQFVAQYLQSVEVFGQLHVIDVGELAHKRLGVERQARVADLSPAQFEQFPDADRHAVSVRFDRAEGSELQRTDVRAFRDHVDFDNGVTASLDTIDHQHGVRKRM